MIACDSLLRAKVALDQAPPRMHRLDKWLRHPGMLRGPDQAVIVDGSRFMEAVLPFSDTGFQPKQCSVHSVDPNLVMAGCYRQPPEPEDPHDVMDALDQHSVSNGLEVAQYVRVEPFDIYVACEGKNRVTLYRKFNRNIIARVTPTHYPPANDLQLVELRPFGIAALIYVGGSAAIAKRLRAWQAIRIDRYPGAILPFEESIAVLKAYGVRHIGRRISLSAWLRRRQALLTVANAYYVR